MTSFRERSIYEQVVEVLWTGSGSAIPPKYFKNNKLKANKDKEKFLVNKKFRNVSKNSTAEK